MMTRNLWWAEWLKTRKRPVNRGMLGIMLMLLVVGFVIVTGLGRVRKPITRGGSPQGPTCPGSSPLASHSASPDGETA